MTDSTIAKITVGVGLGVAQFIPVTSTWTMENAVGNLFVIFDTLSFLWVIETFFLKK